MSGDWRKMDRSGKIWGNTSLIFARNNIEVHRIEGKRGHYCSKHKHEHKYNMFYVESGILRIGTWKNNYPLVDETTLGSGETTIIIPGEYHRFEVVVSCVAFEFYYTTLDSSDIVRDSVGGKCE